MSTHNKALMTHYADGALVCGELRQMFYDAADAHRFDRDMAEDHELFREQKLGTPYGGVRK